MDPTITCMTCGGIAHLMNRPPPDEPLQTGDVATFVCEDCRERIDLVVGDESGDDE